jgi:inorganic phosphate transporter, PiT family
MNSRCGASPTTDGGTQTRRVSAQLIILILVVVVALGFDFTNGFHDTGNAMATSIATGALKPRIAVILAAILNLVGAFLSVEVALTVTNAVVNIQDSDGNPIPSLTANSGNDLLMIILAGLVGGIVWNVLTWMLGIPSSSSHALFGGLMGATVAGIGWSGVNWDGNGSSSLDGVLGKVILPGIASPIVACIVATVGTFLIFQVTRRLSAFLNDAGFRYGQIGSASLVALAHGTNDAQKTMGVITLALIGYGSWTSTTSIPLWVKFCCAIAISLGTYVGGWRVIRTLGKGLVEIEPRQGMGAEGAASAVILASSQLGMALSTTQVATGSILGAGVGKPGAQVRWAVAGRMVVAWVVTLPAAGIVGAAVWWVGNLLGDSLLGAIAECVILILICAYMVARTRMNPITPDNVNDEWTGNPSISRRSDDEHIAA